MLFVAYELAHVMVGLGTTGPHDGPSLRPVSACCAIKCAIELQSVPIAYKEHRSQTP